jgi:hypothetical protein
VKTVSKTDKRIEAYLRGMKKAMPEILRQIKVYEDHKKAGTLIKNPKPGPQFKNA